MRFSILLACIAVAACSNGKKNTGVTKAGSTTGGSTGGATVGSTAGTISGLTIDSVRGEVSASVVPPAGDGTAAPNGYWAVSGFVVNGSGFDAIQSAQLISDTTQKIYDLVVANANAASFTAQFPSDATQAHDFASEVDAGGATATHFKLRVTTAAGSVERDDLAILQGPPGEVTGGIVSPDNAQLQVNVGSQTPTFATNAADAIVAVTDSGDQAIYAENLRSSGSPRGILVESAQPHGVGLYVQESSASLSTDPIVYGIYASSNSAAGATAHFTSSVTGTGGIALQTSGKSEMLGAAVTSSTLYYQEGGTGNALFVHNSDDTAGAIAAENLDPSGTGAGIIGIVNSPDGIAIKAEAKARGGAHSAGTAISVISGKVDFGNASGVALPLNNTFATSASGVATAQCAGSSDIILNGGCSCQGPGASLITNRPFYAPGSWSCECTSGGATAFIYCINGG